MSETVNSQIVDSVTGTGTFVIGNGPAQAMALLDAVMAETIGMHMHGAVARQQNAATLASAAVAATCARLLQTPMAEASTSTPHKSAGEGGDDDGTDPSIATTLGEARQAVAALKDDESTAKRATDAASKGLESVAKSAGATAWSDPTDPPPASDGDDPST